MNQNKTRLLNKLLTVLLCFFSLNAFALPEDTNQPIHIKAKQSQYDNVKGFLTYTGNVEFKQGTIKIEAETIEITLEDGNITLAVAKGHPAQFVQTTDLDGSQVKAIGRTIRYIVTTHSLEIFVDAELHQNTNQMSGGEIFYNLDTNLANVTGDPNVGDGRMEMIFTPAKSDQE